MQSSPRRLTPKERRLQLMKEKVVTCTVCPLHSGDNQKHRSRRPKPDRYKNKRD